MASIYDSVLFDFTEPSMYICKSITELKSMFNN